MDSEQKCIFISYRRDDSAGETGRLYDQLKNEFGSDRVYLDVNAIEPGVDFIKDIQDAVGKCEILIAVIGKKWLSISNESGRRIDDPDDFVRLEIQSALDRDIRVIPALVQGATLPSQDDLPEELGPLTRRQTLPINHSTFQTDAERLINVIRKTFGEAEKFSNSKKLVSASWFKTSIVIQAIAALVAAPGFVIGAKEGHVLFFLTLLALGVITIMACVILGLGIYQQFRPAIVQSVLLIVLFLVTVYLRIFSFTAPAVVGVIITIVIVSSDAWLLSKIRNFKLE